MLQYPCTHVVGARGGGTVFDTIFEAAFVLIYAVYFFALYAPKARRAKRRAVRDSHIDAGEALLSVLAFIGMQVLPLLAVFTPWLDFAAYTLPAWAGWLGLALYLGFLWLTFSAHADLGRNWSPTLQVYAEHQLVTGGIYRVLRHPIYAGQWLWALAQPLLVWNWIGGLAALATFAPIYLYRVPREEQMMLEQFGDEYREYMERTGGVLPRPGSGQR